MFKNHQPILLALASAVAGLAASFVPTPAQAGAGDLFASDPTANAIIVYALDGTMRTFASGLNSPQGLVFDGFGNLYVADRDSGNIYKFTADGTRSTFASGLNAPVGLVFDGTQLVVSESGGDTLSRLDQDGTRTVSMVIDNPLGVTFGNPNLYVVNGTSLIKIDPGDVETTTAIAGSRGVAVNGALDAFVSSDDGNITLVTDGGVSAIFASGLTTPNGLAFRPKRYSDAEQGVGDLFVAETQAGVVSEFSLAGTRSVFATGGHPKYLAFELILPSKLLNISSRLNALRGDKVLIGGFIITGNTPRRVILRALGPSLSAGPPPVAGALQNPVLELHMPNGTVRTNDDWMTSQKAEIMATELAPKDPRESAIVLTLAPGAYTAIVRGKGSTTGVAVVEAFDLDRAVAGELANISTRGFVQTGDNVLIGGFIIDPTEDARVLIRAIGPSLADGAAPVPDPLANPFLELRDQDGALVTSNDDWQDTARGEINATGIAPTNPRESAILANLRGGNYTAIVRGNGGGSGVALVEIYHLP